MTDDRWARKMMVSLLPIGRGWADLKFQQELPSRV